MVYIKFGIVFELFVYKIYGDSDGAFLCGTEILNSRLKWISNTVLSNFSSHATLFLNESLYKCYLLTKVLDNG